MTEADRPIRRRSVFADRFLAVGDFCFGDERAFSRRGAWREFFASRIKRSPVVEARVEPAPRREAAARQKHCAPPDSDRRLVLEIGCNDASLLATVAAKHPSVAFVGIDWKYRALHTAAERIAAAGLVNVALLHGRGQDVARIFGEGEVDEIWIFHPDPCDKPQELRNRLFAEPFLIDAHRVLRAGGSLVLKTDHPGYYQWALALFGLPEPAAFTWARERSAGEQSVGERSTGERSAGPRVRVKDLVELSGLPPRSEAAVERFDVSASSADYWNDDGVRSAGGDRCFWGEATPFEARFIAKRLPIYYLELARRSPRPRRPASDARTPCP